MAQKSAHTRMRTIAERQWGVISFTQLLGCRFTVADIAGMVGRGHLIRIHRGVYALGHRRLTIQGTLHAAQLAAGDGAFLSHRSAAAVRGLSRHPREVELTAATGHTPARRPGLRIHRTTIPVDRAQARPFDGLLVATIPRIVLDLAPRERAGELQRLIQQAIRTGGLDHGALGAAIAAASGRPGAGLARAALQRYLPGSEDRRSWLETQFQTHERSDPRLPTPRYNVHLLGYEVDVLWERARVALELDGRPYHVAVEDFDRDRSKDRTLLRHHYTPVRVSDFEWEHDRPAVLGDLYAILERE